MWGAEIAKAWLPWAGRGWHYVMAWGFAQCRGGVKASWNEVLTPLRLESGGLAESCPGGAGLESFGGGVFIYQCH